MSQKTSTSNRMLAFLLCMVMVLSTINVPLFAFAESVSEITGQVTDAELVADNYASLTNGEKEMLLSGLFASQTINYPVPQDGSSLISVDSTAKKVVASKYVKDGFTWKPVTAVISYSGGNEEIVLDNGMGSFNYDGNTYTVLVNYELYIGVDEATQSKLLNGAYYVVKGVKNLDDFDYYYGTFDTVGQNITGLKMLADGISLSNGTKLKLENEDTIAAIEALNEQSEINDGMLDVTILIEDYEFSESKVGYLLANGAEFKAVASATHKHISTIVSDSQIDTIAKSIRTVDPATYRKINLTMNAMRALVNDTEDAANDEWGILDADKNPLKDGLTAEELQALDNLVIVADGAVYHDDAIKAELLADKVTLTANVNRLDITVNLSAEVISSTSVGSDELTPLTSHTAVVQVPEGATAEEVLAAIKDNGIEALALSAWGGISVEHYVRTADVISGNVTSNITYNIKYTPKRYNVTYGFETTLPTSVYYGYRMILPIRVDTSLVYDYTVNGKTHLQGEIIKITSDTQITRTEGNPWSSQQLNKIIAESYASELTDVQKNILSSTALNGESLSFKDPGSVTVSLLSAEGENRQYLVDAPEYASGLNGLVWKAATGKAIVGSGTIVATFEFVDGKAIFEVEQLDRVEVEYRLVLNSVVDEEKVLSILNLPSKLAEEAAEQKANIATLDELYPQLGQLTKASLNQIKFGVGGSNMSKEAKDAVDAILSGCVDPDAAQLYLYRYLTEYRAKGLAYYYQGDNYQRMRNQMKILNANLSTIYNDPEFLPLLKDIEYEHYYDQIGSIIKNLNKVVLSDPNKALNTSSPALADLVALIEKNTDSKKFDKAEKDIYATKIVTGAAPQRAIATITVQAKNSAGEIIKSAFDSAAFDIGNELSAANINSLNAMVKELIAKAGIDTVHYTTSDTLGLKVGDVLDGNVEVFITYTPVKYTTVIKDSNGQTVDTLTFAYDIPTILLPGCDKENVQYRYIVGGSEIIVGKDARSYTFTNAQIDNNAYAVIVRETIDVYREGVLGLINDLNKAISDSGLVTGNDLSLALIPMEDANGNFTLVLRVFPGNLASIGSAVGKIAEVLTASDFTHIKLGDSYLREDSTISIQAVLDVLLNSGMSLDTILGLIKANGDINELVLDGVTVIGADANGNISISGKNKINNTNLLGGKLLESALNFSLGKSEAGVNVKLYVTIEDFDQNRGMLKSLRENTSKIRPYGNITAHEGMFDIELNAPDKAYQAFLTAMLALNNTSLKDIENIDILDAKELVFSVLELIAYDKTITIETFENTLKQLGQNIDLSAYSSNFESVREILAFILNTFKFSNEASNGRAYTTDIHVGISKLLDQLGIADALRGMIKENQTGLNFGFKFGLVNKASYQALIIDASASGTNKLVYTSDLAASLKNIHDNTIIILLSDINGNVTINKKVFLDYNGNKINGNLTCNAQTIIIDSSIANDSGAGVTGKVSGNAVITAGTYEQDISSLLKDGYKLVDKTVRNDYYYVTVDGDNVNVYLSLDLETLKNTSADSASIAVEIAGDLLMNYYMSFGLKLGGNTIYDMNVQDVIGLIGGFDAQSINDLLDCIDCEGITAFVNDLLANLADFSALGAAAKNGTVAFSYQLEKQPWAFEIVHVKNGDYISVNVVSDDDKADSKKINFYVEKNDTLGDTLESLGEIVKIDTEIDFADISFDSAKSDLTLTGGLKFDLVVDLTSNTDYAIAVGVVLANGVTNTAKRDALVNGIKTWYASGKLNMTALKAAIENVTTEEFIKAFEKQDSFSSMLSKLGLNGIVENSASALYGKAATAIKYAFALNAKLADFKGNSVKFGSLEKEYGAYGASKGDKTLDKVVNISGSYGIAVSTTIESVSGILKLFKSNYETYKIIVTKDGEVLYKGNDLGEAFAAATSGSVITVYEAVAMTADITLMTDVDLAGTSLVDFGGKVIILGSASSKLTADKQITANVSSYDESAYEVNEEELDGKYVYTLKEVEIPETYKIIVTNNGEVLYKGNDLGEAFAAATSGSVITVYESVAMTADITLTTDVELVGAAFIDFDGKTIILGSTSSKLTSDKQITDSVASYDESAYEVNEEEADGKYVYTLKEVEIPETYKIIVTNNGEVLYKGNDLGEAFAAATSGSVITVYEAVAMTADITLTTDVELVGAAFIDFDGKTIILGSTSSKLTSDKQITDSVASYDESAYEVNEEEAGGKYVYTLKEVEIPETYKIIVTKDGEVLYKGDSLVEAFAAATSGSVITVYEAVAMTADVTLLTDVELAGTEFIDFDGKVIILDSLSSKLTADKQITANVVAYDSSTYKVNEEELDGKYVYTLKEAGISELFSIIVNDKDGVELYKGNSLSEAFAAATSGSTIRVIRYVSMEESIELATDVTLIGTNNISFTDYEIILADLDAKLTADNQIADYMASFDENYKVAENRDGDNYVYTLERYSILIKDNDTIIYIGDDINEALEVSTNGSIMYIFAPVTMKADYVLEKEIIIYGSENLVFDNYKIFLLGEDARILAVSDLSENIGSADPEHRVVSRRQLIYYVYELNYYKVIVTSGMQVMYKGDDVNEAFKTVRDGSNVIVYETVALSADIELNNKVILLGAANIDFGGYKIVLKSELAKLTSDKQITNKVASFDAKAYEVTETKEYGDYVYTLKKIDVQTYKVIVTKDGVELYKGDDINKAFEAATTGSTITVYESVSMKANVTLNKQVTLVGAVKVSFGTYKITFKDTNAKLTSDAKLTSVAAPNSEHIVVETKSGSNYVYTLKAKTYKVVVVKDGTVLYKGDDINAAFSAATNGSTIAVNESVSMKANVTLDKQVTLAGASKISFGSYKINLKNTNAKLTSDAKLTSVASADKAYEVVESKSGNNFVYTLNLIYVPKVVVTNAGKVLYSGDDIDEAFASATAGSTITVSGTVTMKTDAKINGAITVVGGAKITLNNHKMILMTKTSKLTIDVKITANVISNLKYGKVSESGKYVYSITVLEPSISGPSIKTDELILGYKVIDSSKTIVLDVLDPESLTNMKLSGNGITAKQLIEKVKFTFTNVETSQISVLVNNNKLSDNSLVPTGAVIMITASNADSNVIAKVNYEIVILGDVNCNGRIDSGDAKLMSDHYLGVALLKENALLAADTNCNGRVDSGDAVKNSAKFSRPGDYKSTLK